MKELIHKQVLSFVPLITQLKCLFMNTVQRRSENPSNQAFEGVKFMTKINASDIFGKFFDVKFFILDNVIPQMPRPVVYQTRPSFFLSTRDTQRKINIC